MEVKKIQEQLQESLINYLDSYFLNRDYESTLSFLSQEMHGFGTGLDEIGYSADDFRSLYERDFKNAPAPIIYTIKSSHITTPIETLGIISFVIDIETVIEDQKVKLKNLRTTLVFVNYGGKWLIEHKHISFPASEHEGGESYPNKELEERNTVLQRMVREKTIELERAVKEIRKLAVTDRLTGLFNRLKIDEVYSEEFSRSERYGNSLSIIMIDLDLFKNINDRYGHLSGDIVLRGISNLLNNNIRKIDIIGRWGGEEFLIICPETKLAEAVKFAEKLRVKIAGLDFKEAEKITASFGVSEYTKNDCLESLLERVDKALYKAKESGRNHVEVL